MSVVPFTSFKLSQIDKFLKNLDDSLATFDECLINLEKDEGKALKEYFFGTTNIDVTLKLDMNKSYGEMWIQDTDCYIASCLKVDIIENGKDISKDELIEISITNGKPKSIQIVTLI